MDSLIIEQTTQSPRIILDAAAGTGEIVGVSFPDRAAEFYAGVVEWMEQYFAEGNTVFNITLSITYFNTASKKFVRDLFVRMNELYLENRDIRMTWYHEDGDDDMEEFARAYSVRLDVPIEIKAY